MLLIKACIVFLFDDIHFACNHVIKVKTNYIERDYWFDFGTLLSRLRVVSLSRPGRAYRSQSSETHSKCRCIYGIVPAPWAWSGPLSGRGLEARKRFTWPLLRSPDCALGNPILRQSTLVLLSVTARSLAANEEESTLTPRVTFITISQMQSVPGN